jgi:hypothetical protein
MNQIAIEVQMRITAAIGAMTTIQEPFMQWSSSC